MKHAVILQKLDISKLEATVIKDGLLTVQPSEVYLQFSMDELKNLMVKHGIYVIPTQELIDFLRDNIIGKAIEIGAGNGAVGRALGIPITDSRMQEDPSVQLFYTAMGQPPIVYPNDVEKLNSDQALNKYKPDTVIGCFITHKWEPHLQDGNMLGVKEEHILQKAKRYINVGNKYTHRNKPILNKAKKELFFPWLITRAISQELNRIWIY